MRSFSSNSTTPQLAHCRLQTSTLNCTLETHATQHHEASSPKASSLEASNLEASNCGASDLEVSNLERSKPGASSTKNITQPTCAQTSEQSTAAGTTPAPRSCHFATEPDHAKQRMADADSTAARRLVKKVTHTRRSSTVQHAATQAAARGPRRLHRSVST